MYVPASFAQTDSNTLRQLIDAHSFATLISRQGQELFASHLPLLRDVAPPPKDRLIGHMARANPQWRDADGQSVLAIFHGPHAYVSPTWYEAVNVVPTWNYVAVHVYGTLRIIESHDRLRDVLERTIAKYESGRQHPWTVAYAESDFIAGLHAAIVGFEIEIERIEGKWKLGQNHDASRREKVVHALSESSDVNDRSIAALMHATLAGPPR